MHTYLPAEMSEADVVAYLQRHGRKEMLRFLTAGSVDDGKSTLIGRLLFDSKLIYEDQLAAVVADSAVHGTSGEAFDPALLTDGLKAEREQGITIDVAYRYFSTERRHFIIADTPGHEQYTRNMATGASTCDLAIILVDARHGVVAQTRRHSFIASLLGIRQLVVAVNKMDLVGYDQEVFERIRHDYEGFAARLEDVQLHFIPLSALKGDNVVEPSARMPWYGGGPLLYYLETVPVATQRNLIDLRFPVQLVLRPHQDYRGYAGTIASGVLRPGDEVVALPSGRRTRVKAVGAFEGELAEAFAPMAVTVQLEDDVDLSRGDMLTHVRNRPQVTRTFEAVAVWMHETAMQPGRTYLLKAAGGEGPAVIDAVRYRFDIHTMHRVPADRLELNEIGRVAVSTHRPLCIDPYRRNKATGAMVLIDRDTNATVAALMVLAHDTTGPAGVEATARPRSAHVRTEHSRVSREERERLLGQRAVTIWLTGLSGAGKSTVAQGLERRLFDRGVACTILDGDNVRQGLNRDLGFSAPERTENIRRVAEVAALFNDAGLTVITSFISPFREDRDRAREIIGAGRFVEVYLDAPLDTCETRDPKGLYRKARAGEIGQFTGIDAPYEPPEAPALTLHTADADAEACVAALLDHLAARRALPG